MRKKAQSPHGFVPFFMPSRQKLHHLFGRFRINHLFCSVFFGTQTFLFAQKKRYLFMGNVLKTHTNEEMQTTALNPIQLHLLRMFSYMNSEAQLTNLKQVLAEYYFNEVEKGMANLESKGLWGREQSDEVMNEHLRTPYVF